MWLCTCMYEDEFDAICILHSVDRALLYSYFALRLSALLPCIPVLFIQPILLLSFFHRIQPVWSENSRYSRKDDEQRQSRNSSNVCETPALREVGKQTNNHRKYFNYLESFFVVNNSAFCLSQSIDGVFILPTKTWANFSFSPVWISSWVASSFSVLWTRR